jgi:hypothetical protein
MHNDRTLVECKTVLEGKRQITLKATDLRDLSNRAVLQGRIAVMHVRLAGANWVLLTEDDHLEREEIVAEWSKRNEKK